MAKPSFESKYNRDSIENWIQPAGGRDLSTYETRLMFNRKDLEGKKILDLGAGPEVKFAKELAEAGIKADVTSLSPDFSEARHAKKALRSLPDAALIAGTGQALPFRNESFDRVFALHVDEHLNREMFLGFISEMARVLKRGGEAKLGPTRNIPGEWHPYEAILENEQLINSLNSKDIAVIKEPIPEEIMPKTKIKDSYNMRYEMPSYNVVLRKSNLPIREP